MAFLTPPLSVNLTRRRVSISSGTTRLAHRSHHMKPSITMAATDDPVEVRVRQNLAADGVNLDELLNAAKVVNLTRKLDKLVEETSSLAPGTEEYLQAQKKVEDIENNLVREKRQVMQQWLKSLFLAQAVIFVAVGGVLSNDAIPSYSVPLVGQALGFWTTWLFSIPALRARKGLPKWEKSALNVAFLATPLLNLSLPFLTKNCGLIWAADVALLVACYGYYRLVDTSPDDQINDGKSPKERGRVKGILKYLDWGSWR